MAKNRKQHFVPQHYLRQFRVEGTKQIATSVLAPYKFIGCAAISRQCQEDFFYEKDGKLDELLQGDENAIAPVLVRVANNRAFDKKEVVALRLLAVVLHMRTRKAVETAKVLPRRIVYSIIMDAIARGELRAPKCELTEEMMDFTGVAGVLMENSIPCWLEMQTLSCKLLEAKPDAPFITSDHPVVIMNQYFASEEPNRSYAGFSRSGFQLLMPISSTLCMLFYDPRVYKVGSRGSRLVPVCKQDVEIINSLQVQNAEKCVYFQEPSYEPKIRDLVFRYGQLRTKIQKAVRVLPGATDSEEILHLRTLSPRLLR